MLMLFTGVCVSIITMYICVCYMWMLFITEYLMWMLLIGVCCTICGCCSYLPEYLMWMLLTSV